MTNAFNFLLAIVIESFKDSFYKKKKKEKKHLFLHGFTFIRIIFYPLLLYKRVSQDPRYVFLMDILYSMFIPTRFILCNKLTEILIVSHGLFSIHSNQVSFNWDKFILTTVTLTRIVS